MRIFRNLIVTTIMLAALAGAGAPAPAAESYDSCTGFVDAIPTLVTTQGTWCLRQDLTSSSTNINAIEIQTNNVTIDCNGFKLGNLGAGTGTSSFGIYAANVSNITVRHCTIRGFREGMYINGPGNALVEDNQLLLNRSIGIEVAGPGSVVRRNLVVNTGGGAGSNAAIAIDVQGDVIDNVVDGISGDSGVASFTPEGIDVSGVGSLVQGNRIRNLVSKGFGTAFGILAGGTAISLRDNTIVQGASTTGYGVFCNGETRLHDNLVRNYSTALSSSACHDDGGNVVSRS